MSSESLVSRPSLAQPGYTTKTGFTFPSIHNFPPFFTAQPTLSTWEDQSSLWATVILAYYKHHRLYKLELNEAVSGGSELFANPRIKRSAEWDTAGATGKQPQKTQCFIHWRKPEEWANYISSWASDNGMNNSILTLYELANGDSSEGTDLHEIDTTVLLKALDVLVKRGVAQIFAGTSDPESVGVKFFGIS
ncbi:vacuolar protein sorting 25 [Endogone sp. FLAS-F59071]|nr:vacuolar protein sorting 25 [Endogone sp. FLAS-F59071]|eukprot:RUS19644.1 vacuolar protein sorting 25 [Endogone sp. FLAS-F59071]